MHHHIVGGTDVRPAHSLIGGNTVVQLHFVNNIHNCFGYLRSDEPSSSSPTQQHSTTAGYHFFECLPVAAGSGCRPIILQIYPNDMGKIPENRLLLLNGHFASVNGLKHGEKIILMSARTYRCKSVELHAVAIDDWECIVANSSHIEEIFLSQVRVIRSGMYLALFIGSNGNKIRPMRFCVNVPGSSTAQNFLLDMDTRVLVLPGDYGGGGTTTNGGGGGGGGHSPSAPAIFQQYEEMESSGTLEQHIGSFLLPKAFSARLLPSDSVNFCYASSALHQNDPFYKKQNEMFQLINALPLAFILEGKLENGEQRKYLAEIGGRDRKSVGAILVELGSSPNGLPQSDPFLCKLAQLLEKANGLGLRHFWASPRLKRIAEMDDLEWIQFRPIPIGRLQKIDNILAKLGPNGQNCLGHLFAANKRLGAPWLFSARDGMEIGIGKEKIAAKLSAKFPPNTALNDAENFYYFWPLSPELHVEIEKEEDWMVDEKWVEEEEVEGMGRKWMMMEVTAQEELIGELHSSLLASIKHSLIGRHTSPRPGHLLLNGPIGSGKTTILAKLAEKMRTVDEEGMAIEGGMVDFAGKSPAEIVKPLKATLARLEGRWPSALFLDNFDGFAEKTLLAEGDERIGLIRTRKIYQTIFSAIANAKNIPVVCSVGGSGKLPLDEMLLWDGRPFFAERYEIEELAKEEQVEILQKAIGPHSMGKEASKAMNFPTIGDLVRLIERIKMQQAHGGKGELDVGKVLSEVLKLGQNMAIDHGETNAQVRFGQIAGLARVKQRLMEIFIWPAKYPKLFARLEINKRAILHGPSGCGKSLLLRALATEMGVNVLSVKGPELFSKYVGESEQKVRQLFSKARTNRPTLIVFDEFDSLAPQRGSDNAHVTDRLVNQLLTELDGFEEDSNDLFVVAATNRLDRVDKALLRPGRFEHKIYVPKPDIDERLAILRLYAGADRIALSDNVNLGLIAKQTEEGSGAEMRAIIQNALWEAEKEGGGSGHQICQRHLQTAATANKTGGGIKMMRGGNETEKKHGGDGGREQKLALV